MNRDVLLLSLIILGKLGDICISWRPAQGLVPGLSEANPFVARAITQHGIGVAFAVFTLVSLGFVGAFWGVCKLEEARATHRQDFRQVGRLKAFKTIGLAILAVLAVLPVALNLYVLSLNG